MSGSKPGDAAMISKLADQMAEMMKLPPSSTTLDKPRRPAEHSTWCALHLGRLTCDCDWFEKEGRP